MNPWLSCWGLCYSLLNSREHVYKLRSCFWVSLSGPDTQASCSCARTVNISGPHQGCTFHRQPHITSEPTPNKMTWIKKGIHHTESGESMLQATPEEPNGQPLSLLILKMLLYSGRYRCPHGSEVSGHTSSLLSQHVNFCWAAVVKGVKDSWPPPHHTSVSWLHPSFRKGDR